MRKAAAAVFCVIMIIGAAACGDGGRGNVDADDPFCGKYMPDPETFLAASSENENIDLAISYVKLAIKTAETLNSYDPYVGYYSADDTIYISLHLEQGIAVYKENKIDFNIIKESMMAVVEAFEGVELIKGRGIGIILTGGRDNEIFFICRGGEFIRDEIE